jgi:uncharacterized protein (DUF924 family)
MPENRVTESAREVIAFWRNAGPKAWFAKEAAFDSELRRRFLDLHMSASRGELADWGATAEGALGLLLLIDQFPRNMFRGSAHAFATDPLARSVAHAAIDRGFILEVAPSLRPFFALPFEHSEADADQAISVEIAERLAEQGDTDTLKWARIHKDIIDRFGRFPHRNAALGRATTPQEQAFLDQGGFAG